MGCQVTTAAEVQAHWQVLDHNSSIAVQVVLLRQCEHFTGAGLSCRGTQSANLIDENFVDEALLRTAHRQVSMW